MFDSELTRHLAVLSKLSFTDDELAKMTSDMTDIIALMDKVCDFNPEIKPYALDAVDYKDLRKDNHNPSSETENIISNAKNIKNNSFVVPKVV
ncbi:MAG: Asp-tRNA(Asn)/Glu-tRNA(Gln) amidotransferase subunit GatC [bacterium]|nr:Asp-tRNA(Asn)/Glu-tRNA(Gln) amidotransferase subunit GatC [bacterium]